MFCTRGREADAKRHNAAAAGHCHQLTGCSVFHKYSNELCKPDQSQVNPSSNPVVYKGRMTKALTNRRQWIIGSMALLSLARSLRSQKNPTFSTDVKVVNAFVTVRDKKGNIIKDLPKDDFVLSEDGRPQPIRYFSRQSDLPLTVGLLVDTTPSETNMLGTEQRASRTFLETVLRPEKDKTFLIQFAEDVELLQDLTSSREKLEKALGLLESHDSGGRPGRGGGPNSTVLSDAIYLGSNDILKSQEGRKAMILLADGDHIGDRKEQAITAALRADSLVYAIRIYDKGWGGGNGSRLRGLNLPGMGGPGGWGGGPGGGGTGGGRGGTPGRSDGKKNLQEIASRTGGSYFEVSKKQSLEDIYKTIEEELRNQYSLGYTPEANARSGYRKIKVTVKDKDLVVSGREGYYPESGT